jgi:energy-coupling factor transporter ATP-binding protein EcfA2
MFQQLNQEDGITIILVTHDANVARHARRIIQIHDGVIVDDVFSSSAKPAPAPVRQPQVSLLLEGGGDEGEGERP